jgi:hypothetical protein
MQVNLLGANQTEVRQNDKVLFFSYKTLVAANVNGKFYKTNKFYSNTTSKHINKWLENRDVEIVSQEQLEQIAS